VELLCRTCERIEIRRQFRDGEIGMGANSVSLTRTYNAKLYDAVNRRAKLLLEPHCAECAETNPLICEFGDRVKCRGNRPFGAGIRLAYALLQGRANPKDYVRISSIHHGRQTYEEADRKE
jgi:hypothetical protein